MKGLFNRRLAWLLIVLMLCALSPFQAAADGEAGDTKEMTEEDPLYKAFQAAVSGTGEADGTEEMTAEERFYEALYAPQARAVPVESVFAVFYTDGWLVFQNNETPEEGREVASLEDGTPAIYPVDMDGYASAEDIPWHPIRRSIENVSFNVENEGDDVIAPKSVAFWFSGCEALSTLSKIENLSLDRATSMRDLFNGCASLRELNLVVNKKSVWNTAKVQDMRGMFAGCASLTSLDLTTLKTSSVTNLKDAFSGCTGLKKMSLTQWDVSQVTNLEGLFRGCTSLTEVDLGGWNTCSATNMSEMFRQCTALESIMASSAFVTTQVTYSSGMFTGCTALKGGKGTAYDASYTNKAYARLDGSAGQPGYFSAGVFAILYADGMLAFQYGETPKREYEVTESFAVDMTDGYSVKVTAPWLAAQYRDRIKKVNFVDSIAPAKTRHWFYNCVTLEYVSNSQNLDLSQTTMIGDMFYGCSKLRTVDVSGWDTSSIEEAHGVFFGCGNLKRLDVSGWDTSNMTDMSGLFYGCSGISELDVSGFDTRNVTTFSSMFRDCVKLTELDVRNWDTSSVQQMGGMFWGCTGLTELDFSGWIPASCFYCSNMFKGAANLTTIWVSDQFVLDYEGIEANYANRGVDVFADCAALTGGKGTPYDAAHTDYHYLRIDTAGAPGYFTLIGTTKPLLSNVLPLTQNESPVSQSALGSLSTLYVRIDYAGASADRIFVAAFYDDSGRMRNACLTEMTIGPSTKRVQIPASGVSTEATELRVFALDKHYVPIADSRSFTLQ